MRRESEPSRHRRAYRAGQRAERLALLWLALKGYRPLARRFAIRGGEVDLVVRRGSTIAFVEVKMRPTLDEAVAAVTALKVRRVERAAGVWLAQHPWATACTLRGDILALGPRRWPRHLPGAMPLAIGH